MTNLEPGLRVLIVDDAKSLREMLHTLLTQNGYSVVAELDDGASVLATVARTHPDIVCLDLNMPKVSGMTVLRDLSAKYPDVAVVMMTGDSATTAHGEATNLGAAGFLKKPFSPQQIIDELRHVSDAYKLLKNQVKIATDGAPVIATKKSGRVVIADDSVTLRRLLRAILENAGFEVVGEAVDGQHAIDMTKLEKPDLVCLDVEMPVLNGLLALKELHAYDPALPILMITNLADRDTVQQATQFGAKGYIVKPYQPEKVELAVRKLLKL